MYKPAFIELSDSPYSNDRYLEINYTYHGDLSLSVFEDGNVNTFYFAHGNEETLVATSIGFLTRIGLETAQIHEIVKNASADLLAEIDEYESVRQEPINASSLRRMVSGHTSDRFNNWVNGWNAFCPPIPQQPGVLESVGGTGVYSRSDVLGNMSLVLARIQSSAGFFYDEEGQQISELYESDIPVAINLLCAKAMGEYRRSLRWLINDVLKSS